MNSWLYVLNYNTESFTMYHYNSDMVIAKVVFFANYRKLNLYKSLSKKDLAA